MLLLCGDCGNSVCPSLLALPYFECPAVEFIGRALFSQGLECQLWEYPSSLEQGVVVVWGSQSCFTVRCTSVRRSCGKMDMIDF
jgi:hypothetical protein